MPNFPEEQNFSDQNAKNMSETKEKKSFESFEERFSECGDCDKKMAKGCVQKQKCGEQKNQQGSGQQNLLKMQWTEAEENILIEKHRQIGNKWASISQYLNEKNDNCVKNHFYSKLRKMIRKLNRMIQISLKKNFKSVPNATIYKLVEASEERFKQKPICTYEVSMVCQDVISKILKISAQEDLQLHENSTLEMDKIDEYKELIEEIKLANKNYKKKSKKIKNSTIKAPLRTKNNSRTKKQKPLPSDDYSADQSQSESQKSYLPVSKPNNSKPKFYRDMLAEEEQKPRRQQKGNQNKVQIKEGDEMQELLKNIGLLHQGRQPRKCVDQKSEIGSQGIKSFSDFDNQSEALSFFDDSNNCWKKESRMFTRMNKRLFGGSGSEIEGL